MCPIWLPSRNKNLNVRFYSGSITCGQIVLDFEQPSLCVYFQVVEHFNKLRGVVIHNASVPRKYFHIRRNCTSV